MSQKIEEFAAEMDHFISRLNIGASFLDARAIRFFNEWRSKLGKIEKEEDNGDMEKEGGSS